MPPAGRDRRAALLSLVLAIVLAGAACGDDGGSASTSKCGLEGDARCRPESERVDRATPAFSHPTDITNPLFPMNAQVLQLGKEQGKQARNEITRLPDTKTIEWHGKKIDTVVQQFVAYQDGRVVEIALDYFAQADDGSVWYLGENVSNYEDGVVVDHEGTWIAGKDGAAGMIMPAHPKAGDVYRPENIPGLVFEEDAVKSIGETVDAPRGPVDGAIVVQEHLMDGTFETKIFAPGYGEFQVEATDELINVALAVPLDALSGPPPAELETLSSGAAGIFAAAEAGDWVGASATVATMNTAAQRLPDVVAVPRLLDEQLNDALGALAAATAARAPADARQAAIDVERATLDVQLRRNRPVSEVDVARLGVWAQQVLVDAAAADEAAVASDVVILEAIRDRIRGAVDTAGQTDAVLARLRQAADDKDVAAAAAAVPALRDALAKL